MKLWFSPSSFLVCLLVGFFGLVFFCSVVRVKGILCVYAVYISCKCQSKV
jgi:hypothetical protein